MHQPPFHRFRRAFWLPGVALVVLALAPLTSKADQLGDLLNQVGQAQQQANSADQQASQADSALQAAQKALKASQDKMAELQKQIDAENAKVNQDLANIDAYNTKIASDREALGKYFRSSYEQGLDKSLTYLISSDNFSSFFDRQANLNNVSDYVQQLVSHLQGELAGAQAALRDERDARQKVQIAEAQAQANQVVIAEETGKLANLDQIAQGQAQVSNQQLAATKAAYAAALARQAEAIRKGTVYNPIPTPAFTVDTDLTQPSGVTAAQIDELMSGTALAGLGATYVNAEQTYHVSAYYLVGDSILESAWGISQIATDKHNIFGYGADDSHPYQDAYSFASFADCINYVAQQVANNYLASDGVFYHGPTLRGVNVMYASDPNWASKIAKIANEIPSH